MAFTIKARVSGMDNAGDQTLVSFSANYTDPDTGERVNTEWARATPSLILQMHVMNEVVEQLGLKVGQNFTGTFTEDKPKE